MAAITCARCGFNAQAVRTGKSNISMNCDGGKFLQFCKAVAYRPTLLSRISQNNSSAVWLLRALSLCDRILSKRFQRREINSSAIERGNEITSRVRGSAAERFPEVIVIVPVFAAEPDTACRIRVWMKGELLGSVCRRSIL